jgi:hypothetical protein
MSGTEGLLLLGGAARAYTGTVNTPRQESML